MEYRGGDAVTEADCILPVGDGRSASVASALSQAVRLPLDMGEWKKATDDKLINNLRRGLLMVSKNFLLVFCDSFYLLSWLTSLPFCRGSKLLWSWRTDSGLTKNILTMPTSLPPSTRMQ